MIIFSFKFSYKMRRYYCFENDKRTSENFETLSFLVFLSDWFYLLSTFFSCPRRKGPEPFSILPAPVLSFCFPLCSGFGAKLGEKSGFSQPRFFSVLALGIVARVKSDFGRSASGFGFGTRSNREPGSGSKLVKTFRFFSSRRGSGSGPRFRTGFESARMEIVVI